jgi:hypothetical protein
MSHPPTEVSAARSTKVAARTCHPRSQPDPALNGAPQEKYNRLLHSFIRVLPSRLLRANNSFANRNQNWDGKHADSLQTMSELSSILGYAGASLWTMRLPFSNAGCYSDFSAVWNTPISHVSSGTFAFSKQAFSCKEFGLCSRSNLFADFDRVRNSTTSRGNA